MIDCVISILRSNNNYTRSRVFVEACLLKAFLDCFSPSTSKKPAKRGPKPKHIGTWDYCRTRGCFVYLNGTGQLSPSPKATENLFFYIRKQKISQVGFVRIAVIRVIRLEAPALDFLLLTPAFKKASTTMIAFGF